jgi:hypothetical protein
MKTTRTQNLIAAAFTCALASATTAAWDDDASATTPMANSTTPAPAMAPATSDADAWQFGVSIPAWFVGVDGNATLFGRQQNVNVSFNTLRQHLDTSLGLALDASKGKFGVFGNFGYMKFSANGAGPGGAVDASIGLKFCLANGGLSYVLLKTESDHPFVLAGTAGVRYWYTDTRIALAPPGGPDVFDHTGTQNLVDPVIGLRASQYLTRKLHLDVAGDGGGFNISHSTDWTWSVTGMMTYDFAKWFSLSAGYQAVALDESNGGSGRNKQGVDLIFSGAAIAAKFKF